MEVGEGGGITKHKSVKNGPRRKWITSVVVYLGFLLGIFGVLFGGLTLSFLLPNESIRNHIKDAASILHEEGNYPVDFTYDNGAMLDNFTDALILGVAYDADDGSRGLFERVFGNYYFSEDHDPVKSLVVLTSSDEVRNNRDYARYGFGMVGVVRVLMEFMGLPGIRQVLLLVVLGLMLIAIMVLIDKTSWKYGVALATVLLLARPWLFGVSLQFAPMFVITLAGIIAVCLLDGRKNNERILPFVFMTIGACTAFFDLLTVPLMGLGLPLAVVMLLDARKAKKQWFRRMVQLGVFWAVSYSMIYILKWTLASLVLGRNEFGVAMSQLLVRVGAGSEISGVGALLRNCAAYFRWPFWAVIIYTVTWMVLAVKDGLFRRGKWAEWKKTWPFLVLALMPLVWYLVMANHSYIHYWMTNRLLAVSLLSYLFGTILMIDRDRR